MTCTGMQSLGHMAWRAGTAADLPTDMKSLFTTSATHISQSELSDARQRRGTGVKFARADAYVGTVSEFADLLACPRANVSSGSVQKAYHKADANCTVARRDAGARR